MISFSTYQTRFGQLTKNSVSSNLTLGMDLINQSLRYLTGKFYFNERTYTTLSVGGQQFYALPPQVKRLIDVVVTLGNVNYVTQPAPSREYWDYLNTIQFQQNFPSFHFVFNGNQVGIWPNPASSGLTITMNYQIRTTDLSQADYTTGTATVPYTTTLTTGPASGATSATLSSTWGLVTGSYRIVFSSGDDRAVTLTNGSTAVSWTTGLSAAATSTITVNGQLGGSTIVGSGTTFTQSMVNRWIQFTAPSGDNQWYQILSYQSATQITLYNPYSGTASAGLSFTIGEMPILAEDYQDLALYRALKIYFSSIVPDTSRYKTYEALYNEGYKMLEAEYGQKDTTPVLTDTETPFFNPNLFVRSINGM